MKKLLKSIPRFIWNFLIGFLAFMLSIPRFIWNFIKGMIEEIWSFLKDFAIGIFEDVKLIFQILFCLFIIVAPFAIISVAWEYNFAFEGFVLICLISIIVLLISIRKKLNSKKKDEKSH